jgi:uroporphyrinogen-III synthase
MSSSLQGRRILVTRALGQASALAALLAERGAEPVLIPAIELAPPRSWCALDAALASIRSFDWLLFTSANAVHAYATRARTLGLSPQARRVAVIGPATARAVQETGVASEIDLMPPKYVAEAFVEALTPHAAGASILLVRAAHARDVLPDALTAAGAQLTVAEAYQNVVPPASVEALHRLLAPGATLDAVTFTSASTAGNLHALLEQATLVLPASTALASIGPITSQAMRDLGWIPTVEASESTIPALVEALAGYFNS